MREYIFELLQNSTGTLAINVIILRLVMSAILAGFMFLSYRLSHSGSVYSAKFNVSLATLAVITTTVMIVIGNNIALSLGMVGALSIVRFRTAIKDSRDTIYIFWAIVIGICCGAGDYVVASLGSTVIFLVLLVFGRLKSDNKALIILRIDRTSEIEAESLIFQYYDRKATLRAMNTTENTVEFIYEISTKYLNKAVKNAKRNIVDSVYDIKGVEYFNIVIQNDEISS